MKKTMIKIEWNKVTTLSKYIALLMMILLPFFGFVLGMKYQFELDKNYIKTGNIEVFNLK